jgi:hypothetical protein
MASYRGQKEIKFPILKDVEYISVFKNRNSVLEIDGKDVEGISWRGLQLFLGKSLAPDLYQYTMKFKKANEIHSGRIRATIMGIGKTEPETNQTEIIKEFKALKDALSKATNTGGVTFDMLLASTKQGYEAQVSYLNQQIADKEKIINKVENEVNELERDLNDCEKESAKNSGIGQYLAIGEKILSMKFGKPGKVSLKESDQSDIPEQILTVLGIINWSLMDQENINKIANSIQQYLSVLPKEYFKGA